MAATSPSSGFNAGTRANCTADPSTQWQVIPSAYDSANGGFLLYNDAWGMCLGGQRRVSAASACRGNISPSVSTGKSE
jgi:hypothetical protein